MIADVFDGAIVSSGGRDFVFHDERPDEAGHGARWYECSTCGASLRHLDLLAAHECADAFASDEEYLDNVECSGCGETRGDASSCDLSLTCTESGCSCVVARISSCDSTDGMYACADHTPSHRGCPECDPPERDDR